MKVLLLALCLAIGSSSFSQPSYKGFNFGIIYAKYNQPNFDKMKPFLSDSLKLTTPFSQNIKAKGLGFGIVRGSEKKFEYSFSINLLFSADAKQDSTGKRCFLNQTNSNFLIMAGYYFKPWLRYDFGIGYVNSALRIKRGNDFYALDDKVKSGFYTFYMALPILLNNKKHSKGLSISPYMSIGINKFEHNFFDGNNYAGSTKSRLNTFGIEMKYFLRNNM